jgi:hypothetical protein
MLSVENEIANLELLWNRNHTSLPLSFDLTLSPASLKCSVRGSIALPNFSKLIWMMGQPSAGGLLWAKERPARMQNPITMRVTLVIEEAIERWPSAAERDQHSIIREQDYLRTMLSRRQLQGFVRHRPVKDAHSLNRNWRLSGHLVCRRSRRHCTHP